MNDKMQKIEITAIGTTGDGVGKDENGKSWYIPATFIDEIVEAKFIAPRGKGIAGQAVSIQNISSYRQAQPCEHDKNCGGCSLQHMKDDFYTNWQLAMVKDVLSQNGLTDIKVKNIFKTGLNTRRRAVFHAHNIENIGVKVGFYKSFSQEIESIQKCLVLDKKLVNISQKLVGLFTEILKPRKKAEASVTLCENGVDILLKFHKKLKASQLEILQNFDKNLCIRLSIKQGDENPKILWQTVEPVVLFGKTLVPVAVGGFLQATKSGEDAIVKSVIKYVANSNKILELFAGNGTLTLPLLEVGKAVTAVEINSDSLRMLRKGAKKYLNELSILEKDLFKENYSTDELNNFDCVVLDPPRAGAKRAVIAISRAKIAKVVMVSCNIKTFPSDAKILVDAGYKLEEVSIIDQFLWSPHIEVVGCFNLL